MTRMPSHAAAPLLVLWIAASVFAADAPAKDPAPPPAEPEHLKVTVVSVSGPAQKLVPGGETWQPLRKDDVLDELTVIRTGLRARVVLAFSDRGQVTVNRATKIGIGQLGRKGRSVKAHLGLKYGTIRAAVVPDSGPSDFRVTTPVATLSVRGSVGDLVSLIDCDTIVAAVRGRWLLHLPIGKVLLGPGQTGDNKRTLPVSLLALGFVAQLGDVHGGLTPKEIKQLLNNGSGRGFPQLGGAKGVQGGSSFGIRPLVVQADLCALMFVEVARMDWNPVFDTLRERYSQDSVEPLLRNPLVRAELYGIMMQNEKIAATMPSCIQRFGQATALSRTFEVIREQVEASD